MFSVFTMGTNPFEAVCIHVAGDDVMMRCMGSLVATEILNRKRKILVGVSVVLLITEILFICLVGRK